MQQAVLFVFCKCWG